MPGFPCLPAATPLAMTVSPAETTNKPGREAFPKRDVAGTPPAITIITRVITKISRVIMIITRVIMKISRVIMTIPEL
jgi:hypothetical protein